MAFLKKNHSLVVLFLIFFTFLVINLFFYSFITIGLYKLICYESNSLTTFINLTYSNKASNIFFTDKTTINLILVGLKWYKYFMNDFFFSNNISFFYNIIYDTKLNLFFYTNNFILITKNDLNLIFLNFYIRSSNLNWINSISLQKTIILNLNESGLFFFRIYNPSHLNVKLITLYMIYPNLLTLYINKIQCFCFNVIFLYSLEIVDLPVLVYINPFFGIINSYYINNIIIYYIIFLN